MHEEETLESRIERRAHRIWVEEGCPEGRAEAHWELAKFAVAQEDAQSTMLKAVHPARSEPIEAIENQGELPTLTDQGEEQLPDRTV
jgi:hypothetical protein